MDRRTEHNLKLSAAEQRTLDLDRGLAATREALQAQRLAFEKKRKELMTELRQAEGARAEAEKKGGGSGSQSGATPGENRRLRALNQQEMEVGPPSRSSTLTCKKGALTCTKRPFTP